MKVGAVVLGLHVAALVAFTMTQGCITTESSGSGRGAGAKQKGPWRFEHKGGASKVAAPVAGGYAASGSAASYDPLILDDTHLGSDPVYMTQAPVNTYQPKTEPYIVQKGDVLSRLAVEFDTTTQTLIDLNNLSNPDVLYVGQELRVPAGGKKKSAKTTSGGTTSVKKGDSYVIQPGDTLSGIAAAYGVSLNDLRSLNNIKDDKIFAGDTLSIPQGGKAPSAAPKSTPKTAAPPASAPEAADPAPPPAAPPAGDQSTSSEEARDEHLVYEGDTLDDIARLWNVSKSDILRMNPGISEDKDLKAGMRLSIPITE